ncbi:MAG: exopolysaccharide Pel transporter PelG [Streptococcus salivarius]
MAGIGFELRKIYNEDSLFQNKKAYAYAGIVYTGPMLLGILLTAGVVVLTMVAGISENERDYILSRSLTYAIIFSLVITSLFSLVVTRFVADMLYEKKFETIIPSFYASSALMLMIGTPLYALYLALASRSSRSSYGSFALW